MITQIHQLLIIANMGKIGGETRDERPTKIDANGRYYKYSQ